MWAIDEPAQLHAGPLRCPAAQRVHPHGGLYVALNLSRFHDSYDSFPPYVPSDERRHAAERKMRQLRQKGRDITPIEAFRDNRIAKSFWGHAWCRHLERYSDYDNRLPRGRPCARNRSVCHLEIGLSRIKAIVCGSELYDITIRIGALSDEVMTVVTSKDEGLFPSPKEIHLDCDCLDWAGLLQAPRRCAL